MRAVLILPLLISGCILGELDLTGKECPCNGAYVCDTSRNVCVKANANNNNDATVPDNGMAPDPDGGRRDAGGPDEEDSGQRDATIPNTCTLDADCGNAEYICENMTCIRRCELPGGIQCEGDEVCNPNNGRCVEGDLELGEDCGISAQCSTGYCLGVTTSTRAGMQRFCSYPCSSTTDCPLDYSCLNLRGISFCLRETAYSPPDSFDIPPGGPCVEGGNSCQSNTCNTTALQCIQRCTSEDDCLGFGDNCWTWVDGGYAAICVARSGAEPGTICGNDTQCRSGVCNRYQATCAAHCCSENDCAANETCAVYDFTPAVPVKICRPKAINAGTLPLGASCMENADCESELCAPANTDGTGDTYCSVPCCEPTDCAALPNGGLCWPLDGVIPDTLFGTCLPR